MLRVMECFHTYGNVCETSKSVGNMVEVFYLVGFFLEEMFLPTVYLSPVPLLRTMKIKRAFVIDC